MAVKHIWLRVRDMDVEWYCNINGRDLGPLSTHEIRAMAERGDLLPADLVRQGKNRPWVQAARVKGLFPARGVPCRPRVALRRIAEKRVQPACCRWPNRWTPTSRPK